MMKPERWRQVDQLFHSALAREPEERAAFLDEACGGDAELRREVESLLAAEAEAENTTKALPARVAAELLADKQPQEVIGRQLSHYRILAPLGKGGMGEVFLAQDISLNRQVALKLLPRQFTADAERVHRFEREARAVSALNHPNILTIHEIGKVEETHFIVTEYVEGNTLRQRMSAARLSLSDALEIGMQIANALAAAHQAGIIHRDIKPENVMVREDGLVKVLDFGLAKLTETRKVERGTRKEEIETLIQGDAEIHPSSFRDHPSTLPGIVMGTVAYMSPEQERGEKVDARTDLFSLGVMLYEMLARRQPFTGETVNHVIVAILEQEPPPLAPEVPAELARVLKQMLAKKVDDRYPSAQDLLADLKKLQMRLLLDAEHARASSSEDEQTLLLKPTTTAAPEAKATAVENAQPTTPDKPKLQKWWIAALLSLVALAGGFFAYRSFAPSDQAIDSLAVLPFQNRSGNADSEYLSDGLAETLIYRLSQLPNLKVSPTSSVFRYKGRDTDPLKVGAELGVQAVMSGRMTQRGEQLTISVELVDVRHNKTLWGEQYERKLSELLTTQRDIAAEITHKLQLKLSGEGAQKLTRNYTDNPEAYQLYLKGRYFWNKRTEENLRKAIEQFKAATDKDSNYALAYAGLADCYSLLPNYSNAPSNEFLPQARAYAERAIAIDDSLGEAHISLAWADTRLWNWAEAEKEFKRGLELSPNYATGHQWYGQYLMIQGHSDEALTENKRAQELEPLSLSISLTVAQVYLAKGDADSAVEQLKRVIDLDPNWPNTHQQLAMIYVKQGRNAEALAEAEKSVELSKRQSVALGAFGYVLAQTGKRSEALQVAEELKARFTKRQAKGIDIGRIYLGLKEKEEIFAWLEKDFEDRDATMPLRLALDPLNALRDEARYKDLRKRMKLPE